MTALGQPGYKFHFMKYVTSKNIIILLLIAAVIFLWDPFNCRSKPAVLDIDPVEERDVRVDTIIEKDIRERDSVIALQKKAEKESIRWKDLKEEADDKIDMLKSKVEDKISEAPCPDEYKNDLTKDFSKYQNAISESQKACQKSLLAKDKEISLAKSSSELKSATIEQLKKEMAGCLKDTKKAVDFAKNRSRNELYAGISLNVYPIPGYGVDLGIKMKNGWMFEARALQMDGRTFGQVSAKHTINLKK